MPLHLGVLDRMVLPLHPWQQGPLLGQVSCQPLALAEVAWQGGVLGLRVLRLEQMLCHLLPKLLQVGQGCPWRWPK